MNGLADEVRHCGMGRPKGYHPRHKFMLGRQVYQCEGTAPEAPDGPRMICSNCESTEFTCGGCGVNVQLELLLTASEVKVLTETASKVAYALGRKDAGEEIAAAIEGRRASTAHRIPWEAFTDAANTARRIEADPKQPRIRREPCETHCPCICHDGFGGAHPNEDCRDAQASEDRP